MDFPGEYGVVVTVRVGNALTGSVGFVEGQLVMKAAAIV
jgi:hypothetical protein